MNQSDDATNSRVMLSVVLSDGTTEQLLFGDWSWSVRTIPAGTGDDQTREVTITSEEAYRWWLNRRSFNSVPAELYFDYHFPNGVVLNSGSERRHFNPRDGWALARVASIEIDDDSLVTWQIAWEYLFSGSTWMLISIPTLLSQENKRTVRELAAQEAADWCMDNSVPLPPGLTDGLRIKRLLPEAEHPLLRGRPGEVESDDGMSRQEPAQLNARGAMTDGREDVILAARAKLTAKQRPVFDCMINNRYLGHFEELRGLNDAWRVGNPKDSAIRQRLKKIRSQLPKQHFGFQVSDARPE